MVDGIARVGVREVCRGRPTAFRCGEDCPAQRRPGYASRRRGNPLAGLLLTLSVAFAAGAGTADAETVPTRYWLSPDNRALYVATDAPAESDGPRLYYFSNEADRLCYTFAVSGRWRLDPTTEAMVSDDGRGALGQSLQSAAELEVGADADLVAAAIAAHQTRFAQSLAGLERQGYKRVSRPSFTVAPLAGAARRAIEWSAVAEARWQGRPAHIRQHVVFVEVTPGWVLAIESGTDVALEIIDTLGIAASPDCYRAYVRDHFPQIPMR